MKNIEKDPKFEKEIEKAISFLISAINQNGNNRTKPVILHSIRVGLYLYELGYRGDVVIAAILHDVVEDSKITIKDVAGKFGKEVAELVKANTYGRVGDYQDNFKRCFSKGREALIVGAADILDNSDYYYLNPDKEKVKRLFEKMKYFIDLSKKVIGKEKIYRELVKNFKLISSS